MGPGLTVTTGEETASSAGQPLEATQQPQAAMRPAEAASAPEVSYSLWEGRLRSSVCSNVMTWGVCARAQLSEWSVLARTPCRACKNAMHCWLLLDALVP